MEFGVTYLAAEMRTDGAILLPYKALSGKIVEGRLTEGQNDEFSSPVIKH